MNYKKHSILISRRGAESAKTLIRFLSVNSAPLREILIAIALLLVSSHSFSQESLSLQDAISLTLKNNYSILISKNDFEITKNDNTAGNAGMLPDVTGVAGVNQTVNDLQQNYFDGRVIDRNGVTSSSANAGAVLNWTLFDGLKMFATKEKLAEIQAKGELSYKIQIEKTVQQTIAGYFNVVQQQKLIDAINVNISIDSERVALAQIKLDIGSGSRLDLLQAKVDLNEQISALMKQKALLEESKDNLNYLLSRKAGTIFVVTDSIVVNYNGSPDALRNSVLEKNYTILSAQRDQRISLLSMRETQALRSPVVDFSAGYNYLRTKSEAGLILLNQNLGFNYGASLTWNLFDGFNVNRQVKNARLSYASTGFYLDDLKYQVSTALEKAIRDFNNNVNILNLEQTNILLARENLDIAFERFRSGLSNSLELKEAQRSFQDAESRLVQIQYQAKLSETELMRLNGELVK